MQILLWQLEYAAQLNARFSRWTVDECFSMRWIRCVRRETDYVESQKNSGVIFDAFSHDGIPGRLW